MITPFRKSPEPTEPWLTVLRLDGARSPAEEAPVARVDAARQETAAQETAPEGKGNLNAPAAPPFDVGKGRNGIGAPSVPEATAAVSGKARPLPDGVIRYGELKLQSVQSRVFCALFSPSAPHRYAAEQYRIVRTKIIHALKPPFRLVITSPSIGDGKTFTAVNLAAAMALKSEEYTLLIDADLRRPAIHRMLESTVDPGLSDVLTGSCRAQDAIYRVTELPRLCILQAGSAVANPTELLDSEVWRALAQSMSRQFAHVIIDSPPLEVVADHDLISAVCDGEMLVVRPEMSDRNLTLDAIEKLQPKLVGVLINAATDWFLWKGRDRHKYHNYYRNRRDRKP
jgi:protein-tyrosine kinase